MAKVEKLADRREKVEKKAPKKTEFEAVFLPERETKGAWKFNEVDEGDAVYDMGDAQIGALYIRKSALREGKTPKRVTVSVTVEY